MAGVLSASFSLDAGVSSFLEGKGRVSEEEEMPCCSLAVVEEGALISGPERLSALERGVRGVLTAGHFSDMVVNKEGD